MKTTSLYQKKAVKPAQSKNKFLHWFHLGLLGILICSIQSYSVNLLKQQKSAVEKKSTTNWPIEEQEEESSMTEEDTINLLCTIQPIVALPGISESEVAKKYQHHHPSCRLDFISFDIVSPPPDLDAI